MRLRQQYAGIADVVQALGGVALQAPAHERADGIGRLIGQPGEVRPARQRGCDEIGVRAALYGRLAGQALVQHAAEAEDVGLGIDLLTAGLLGRHVAGCAGKCSRCRAAVLDECGRVDEVRWVAGRHREGDAEVEHLGGTIVGHLDVVGLEIAMNNSPGVRRLDGAGDLAAESNRLLDRKRPLGGDALPERPTRHVLEHQVQGALVLQEVVDLGYVRVVELGDDPGLALQPRQAPFVGDNLLGQRLDGDLAIETVVMGEVDDAHPPAPQLAEHVVRPDERGGPHGVTYSPLLRVPVYRRWFGSDP